MFLFRGLHVLVLPVWSPLDKPCIEKQANHKGTVKVLLLSEIFEQHH